MEGSQGLSSRRAAQLLEEYGENRLESARKTSPLAIFAGQFRDALVMILLGCTLISCLMGDAAEALAIAVIVLLNALLGFFQEYRTERTLEKLGEMAAPTAVAIRDGQPVTVPASQLVPGDVVLLEAGNRVPADGVLLEAKDLSCDESMLTGESVGVEKNSRSCQVYMGTLVTRGKGRFQVTHTGQRTEMGKIAGMLSSIEEGPTPLQQRLDHLGRVIGFGCLGICAVVAVAGIIRGEDPLQMVITGVSLSVAAVPEGLPAIVTIALALAVGRMVRRGALIRRLHAVETLGCATVICSDKTGTLTENRMTVTCLETLDRQVEAEGSGLVGRFRCQGAPFSPGDDPVFSLLLLTAAHCNSALLAPDNRILGEPTEQALLAAALWAGVRREGSGIQTEGENPFDSSRKMMSTLVRRPDGTRLLLAKGAPDLLLRRCTAVLTPQGARPLTPALRQQIAGQNTRLAGQALRVLGFACRIAGPADLAEEGFTFLGLAGLWDPPRKDAREAVARCRRAHIRPVMITGDHAVTAQAIARKLSICREGDPVLTGSQLDQLDDRELDRQLGQVSVFARVTPAHKLRLVRAFKARGGVVAMTGDGVNDAPAVKEADIGVAMGITGTDVTKEAASVILLDDSFATLVAAVEEGRVIYQNIRKFIRYLLSCNIGEVVTMFFAMLMGMPIPLLPIQILLINLATDGLPAIALGLDPPSEDVMAQPPRRAGDSIFSGGLATTILTRGFLIGLTTLAVFTILTGQDATLEQARTGALTALVASQLIHVFECKSEKKGLLSIHPLDNPLLIGAVGVSALMLAAALYTPLFSSVFQTVPLTGKQLLTCLIACLAAPLASSLLLTFRHGRPARGTVVHPQPLPLPPGGTPSDKHEFPV